MVVLKNITVATDFSEPSAVALAYGRDLAKTYRARLHVLHVVEDVVTRYSPEIAFSMPDMQKSLEKSAASELEALLTDEDRRTLDVVPAVTVGVHIADTIVSYADANRVDLIITGTHGRSGVKHLLLGSVAERVVRTARCPVLTVHSGERGFITGSGADA